MLWYSLKPLRKFRKIYLLGEYPAVGIYKEKFHVHRLLMMYWEDRSLKRDEYVHHKDENKLNTLRTNLEIVPESEHQSFHNKGRIFSPSHRAKIGKANTLRRGAEQKKKRDHSFR